MAIAPDRRRPAVAPGHRAAGRDCPRPAAVTLTPGTTAGGISDRTADAAPGSGRPAALSMGGQPADDHPADVQAAGGHAAGRAWLRGAMAALAVLAGAAAVVSWDAQFVMVRSARGNPVVAALEAGIPDAGALIFASLGIALALHGRRALRPRALNLACIGISLAMNALAAGPAWQDLAIWVMPAAVYALASDTLIGVVRAWALARMQSSGAGLADADVTPLAVAGALLLWLLRLGLAPASTLAGFRRWVVEECPVAPGRKALPAGPASPELPPGTASLPPPPGHGLASRRRDGKPRKQDLLIALASQRHDLRRLPLNQVARIASEIGGEVSLHQGTARRVLKAHVEAVQGHDAHPGQAQQTQDGHPSRKEGRS